MLNNKNIKVTETFTDAQLSSIADFFTYNGADMAVTGWVIYNDLTIHPCDVVSAKTRHEDSGAVRGTVTVSTLDGHLHPDLVPGISFFVHELDAVQYARERLKQRMEPLIKRGMELIEHEKRILDDISTGLVE